MNLDCNTNIQKMLYFAVSVIERHNFLKEKHLIYISE